MKKRISKRKYPSKKCKKPGCNEEFIPTDKRQLYCSAQHRVDHNNDLRDIREKPQKLVKAKNTKNEKILAKIHALQKAKNYLHFNFQVLELDEFDQRYYTDVTVLNGIPIYWNYYHGLQGINGEKQTFTTHYRKILPL